MQYQKTGIPEENELVLCTVTNVQYNSVFCKLDEYGNSGMIHISEVSPGRIRNIRDYVTVGKKVVCKILRIDKVKGHIDLSLRRVTENQRRAKNAEIKQELKAEKLIEFYAKQEINADPAKTYKEIATPLLEEYEYLHNAFDEVVSGEADLAKLGVPAVHVKKFSEIIKEKIPPPSVTIKGVFTLSTYHEDGVSAVKKALLAARDVNKELVDIRYLGNGRYRLVVTASDYAQAEPIVEQATTAVQAIMDAHSPSTVVFEREAK